MMTRQMMCSEDSEPEKNFLRLRTILSRALQARLFTCNTVRSAQEAVNAPSDTVDVCSPPLSNMSLTQCLVTTGFG